MPPRLRIFAGPNGSGKTTLASWLAKDYAVNLYHFINADMLFAEVSLSHRLPCPFEINASQLLAFVRASTFTEDQKQFFLSGAIRLEDEFLIFEPSAINSYTVAMLAEFYHSEYLARGASFSLETVFSHTSKLDLLKHAKEQGYRTYLYFIATDSPDISVARVSTRVRQGGHDVPIDKILTRYTRSLHNATLALPLVNRAYFFDNSGEHITLVAEATDQTWQMVAPRLPKWFCKHFEPLLTLHG